MIGRETVDTIDRETWLNQLGGDLQKYLADTVSRFGPTGQQVSNALHGVWFGHPLHPALTDVPIGAWTVALILDMLGDDVAPAADTAVGIGLVGAMGAALTGANDWRHTDERAFRVGLMHGLLNSGAASLYVTSLLARKSGARGLGKATSLLGYSLMTFSAYLGGDLIMDQRIGVNHATTEGLPEDFEPVLDATDLAEGQMKRVDVGNIPILLVRSSGQVLALTNTCSHLGGPLSDGKLEDGCVTCPWHGSRFKLTDGRVVDGPATFPVPALEARVWEGRIEVRAIQ